MRTKNLVLAVAGALTLAVAQVASATVVSFTTVGSTTWTVPAGVTSVDVLVVGGGGGGQGYGGGGGGGEVLEVANYAVTPGSSLPVTVGDGGAGGPDRSYIVDDSNAPNGDPSVFDTLTAVGGDGGHWHWTGEFFAGYGQGGTSGNGLVATVTNYGSGSGASVAGSDAAAGGDGLQSIITGNWYGGGGGSLHNMPGGLGGGGAGRENNTGLPGDPNTGGGGGAGHGGFAGGAGGSGIVVVSYIEAPPPGVPEPASLSVLGLGGLLLLRRRSRA